MWIYSSSNLQTETKAVEAPNTPHITPKLKFSDEPIHADKKTKPDPRKTASHQSKKRNNPRLLSSRKSNLFSPIVFCYFASLFLSGVMRCTLKGDDLVFVGQYIELNRQVYQTDSLVMLWSRLFLQAALPVVLIFLFNQTALGRSASAVFLSLYGFHSGLLTLESLLNNGISALLVHIAGPGLCHILGAAASLHLSALCTNLATQRTRFLLDPDNAETAHILRRKTKQFNRTCVFMLALLAVLCCGLALLRITLV